MTWTMGDISNPGTLKVSEQAVAFYLGGDTPHEWTTVQVAAQTATLRLPTWTYGLNAGKNGGLIDAVNCRDSLLAHDVPRGTKVVIDMETHVDPDYVTSFEYLMSVFGYGTAVYGSRDYIDRYPAPNGGRWVADWTGVPHFTGVAGEFACQWQKADAEGNDKPWDISAVKDISGFWNTEAIEAQSGLLVMLPSGSSRMVKSTNNGRSWS